MSEVLDMTMYGEAVGKQRPKFNTMTGRAYTPAKTANFESTLAMSAQAYLVANNKKPLQGPFNAFVQITKAVPASWSNKKKKLALEGLILPTGKPDIDNVAKAVLDSLNGVWFSDDSHCTQLVVGKKYGEESYYRVMVFEVKHEN